MAAELDVAAPGDEDLLHLAEKVARAFHEHTEPDGSAVLDGDWDDAPEDYRKGLYITFYQLLDKRIIEIGPEIMAHG